MKMLLVHVEMNIKISPVAVVFIAVIAVVDTLLVGGNAGDDYKGPAFLEEPPSKMDFSNSSQAMITCRASGHPQPSVQWVYGDGTPVTDVPGLRKLFNNGSLTFLAFRSEDYKPQVHAAVYACMASNSVGTILSRRVHVRAVVDQFYEAQVYDEYVIFANTALLKCHIPSFVRDYVHVTSWMRQDDGGILKPVIPGSDRYVQTLHGDLHIMNVTPNDSHATHRCETLHRLTGKSKLSTPGRVIVTNPHSSVSPRITHSVAVIEAIEGDLVQLPCEAQGFPKLTHRWYKISEIDGKDTNPVEMLMTERIGKIISFLSIARVQLSDSGLYRCVVSNSVGEERMDTILKIRAPLSCRVLPPHQTVDVSRSALFTCVPIGYPVTSVTWFKDGVPHVDTSRVKLITQFVLRIENVSKDDRGMYQCVVHNGDDEAQGSAQLVLGDISPVLEETFTDINVDPGSQVSLKCAATGQPLPTLHWTLDDTDLATLLADSSVSTAPVRVVITSMVNGSGHALSFANMTRVTASEGGSYSCIASNKGGVAIHTARVNVRGSPMVKPMPNVTVVAGTTAWITCRVTGYPIHSIQWETDGTVLPATRRQHVFDNGTLVLEDINRRLDEKTYRCTVRGNQGKSHSRTMSLKVMVPPLIDPFTFPRMLYEGMRARLTCVVTQGDLPINIIWRKDGREISSDLDVTIRQDDDFSSSITFPSVTTTHSGNYSCIAKNSAATTNYTAVLDVPVPPKWEIQPNDTSATFQSSVYFDCQASGNPHPRITWKKASGRIPGDYRDVVLINRNAHILQNDTLVLMRLQEPDEGYYLCEASNGVGEGLSKVIFLTVHVAAHFTSKYVNKTVPLGHNAYLSCNAKGDTPLAIDWSSNGRKLLSDQNPRFTFRTRNVPNGLESELIINKVQRDDSATFSCFASNAYGKDEAIISVIIQEPPDAPDKVTVIDSASRWTKVTWTQPFDGNNRITGYTIQYKLTTEEWRLGGQNITTEPYDTTTIVYNLLPGTAYNLRIMARNVVGFGEPSSTVSFTTNEEAPSGPPTEVQATALGPESLRVIWKPPLREHRNGNILGYYIGYRVFSSPDPLVYETVAAAKGNHEEINLKSLKKFTKYIIIAKAFNGAGTGPNSDEAAAFTSEDVPSEPPQNVQCKSVGSQSLSVIWEPPPLFGQNGILKGYKVFYKASYPHERVKQEVKNVVLSATSEGTTLRGLDKFTNYSIEVSALTQVGVGVKSDRRYCKTLEDVPGPPSEIKALVSSESSILIVWRKPKRSNGVINKYNVYWSLMQEGYERSTKISVSAGYELSYEVRGLVEHFRYEFWVTASTAVGEGESTSVVSHTPQRQVAASVATFSESVVASWRSTAILPCMAVGSPAPDRVWTIRGRKISDDEHFRHLENGSLLIENLQRDQSGNYTCKVENIFGSDETTHTLHVLAPPLPPQIVVHKTTPSSVVFTWKHADDGGYSVKGYKLKYKRDFGGWEEVDIDSNKDHVVLENLHCGTRYQIRLLAMNEIGASEESNVVTVSTKGAIPRIPSQENVLRVNTTSVTLRLLGWPDSGCRVRHFVVQYRPLPQRDFILVSNNVLPEQENLTIGDLQPGVDYHLQITAHNDAGSAIAEYYFSTRHTEGDFFPADAARKTRPSSSLDTNAIVGVTVPLLIVTISFVVVYFVLRRKKYNRYQHAAAMAVRNFHGGHIPDDSGKRNLGTGPNSESHMFTHAPPASPVKLTKRLSNSPDHEDVCPYATFNLPRGQGDHHRDQHHLQLRTFADDDIQDHENHQRHHHSSHHLHPAVILPDSSKKSKAREEDEHCFQSAANTELKLTVSTRYPHRFPSTDEIEKLKSTEIIDCHDPDRYTFLYDDYQGNHSCLPRYAKLNHLTESAAQLFDQTRVPDLLYHGADSNDSADWPDEMTDHDNSVPLETLHNLRSLHMGNRYNREVITTSPTAIFGVVQ